MRHTIDDKKAMQKFISDLTEKSIHLTDNYDDVLSELLPAREYMCVWMRAKGLTYRQIGEKINLSRERARQIISSAGKKIRHPKSISKIERHKETA